MHFFFARPCCPRVDVTVGRGREGEVRKFLRDVVEGEAAYEEWFEGYQGDDLAGEVGACYRSVLIQQVTDQCNEFPHPFPQNTLF